MTDLSSVSAALRNARAADPATGPTKPSPAFAASLTRLLDGQAAGSAPTQGEAPRPAPSSASSPPHSQVLLDRLAAMRSAGPVNSGDAATPTAGTKPAGPAAGVRAVDAALAALGTVGISVDESQLNPASRASTVEGLLKGATDPVQRAVIRAAAEILSEAGGAEVTEPAPVRIPGASDEPFVVALASPAVEAAGVDVDTAFVPGHGSAGPRNAALTPWEPFVSKPAEPADFDPYTVNSRPDGTVIAPPLPRSGTDLAPGAETRYIFPAEVAREVLQNAGIYVGEMYLDPASPNYTFDALLAQYPEADKQGAIMAAAKIAAQDDAGYWVRR